MGTKIIETGSTAGGIAKVEYKDEAGNVLWYYDDAGNFVRNGNAKITGLAGTGSRMVMADSSGNLSAVGNIYKPIKQFSYSLPATYGINYVNSSGGGQRISLPLAILGLEVEIISKTQNSNTLLGVTGENKIYDIAGTDVTSIYTAFNSLNSVKRIRLIGAQQIDRDGRVLNAGAVDWVVVEIDNA